ncbi:MAG: hypothetical protein NWE94_01840 [Candidatus Bathyarchaeota archaeon]|nr:hypothetical protein [Candidatus Bathyarchaeota archaeon]
MKLYCYDNCGKEIENQNDLNWVVFGSNVDDDGDDFQRDLCPECTEKLKKIIKEGFQ